jgi:hypothetical protein
LWYTWALPNQQGVAHAPHAPSHFSDILTLGHFVFSFTLEVLMTISTTIRVGLHTTERGIVLSQYRCILSGMEGVQTDEDAIDYVRRRIACDRMFGRNALLDMIDNNNYSIERTTA